MNDKVEQSICARMQALEERHSNLENRFEVVEAQLGRVHAVLVTHTEEYTEMRKSFDSLVASNAEMVEWFRRMDELQKLLKVAAGA